MESSLKSITNSTILLIGASRGLGLGLAKELSRPELNNSVFVTIRNPESDKALKELPLKRIYSGIELANHDCSTKLVDLIKAQVNPLFTLYLTVFLFCSVYVIPSVDYFSNPTRRHPHSTLGSRSSF